MQRDVDDDGGTEAELRGTAGAVGVDGFVPATAGGGVLVRVDGSTQGLGGLTGIGELTAGSLVAAEGTVVGGECRRPFVRS